MWYISVSPFIILLFLYTSYIYNKTNNIEKFELLFYSKKDNLVNPYIDNYRSFELDFKKLENDFIRLTASKITSLDNSLKDRVRGFKIFINEQNTVANLAKILEGQKAGAGEINLVVQNTNQEFDLLLPESYELNASFRAAIKSLPGVVEVVDQ